MRHVQRGRQFAKRRIASAAKNNDVLHIAHLNGILFQKDVFVWEKLGMRGQNKAPPMARASATYFPGHAPAVQTCRQIGSAAWLTVCVHARLSNCALREPSTTASRSSKVQLLATHMANAELAGTTMVG
jgi:hypothetical protein